MFAAGGTCFLLIGHLGELDRPLPLTWRMLAGAGIVTFVELAAGLLVNRNYQVWNYSAMTGNFLGQICLPFTLLWIPVSLGAIWSYDFLNRRLFGQPRRDWQWI